MAKEAVTDEVSILKFFETGPIEKVEVVFNIVREKMRERLGARGAVPPQNGQVRKRNARQDEGVAREVPEPSTA